MRLTIIIVLTIFNGFIANAQENKYEIGDFAQGGVIFWLDESGEHGLVCSKSDQSSSVSWSSGTKKKTMALGDGPYSGESNTIIIVTTLGYNNGKPYAASLCNELQITENNITYGDWYLPSQGELYLIYVNRVIINKVSIENGGSKIKLDRYWSSTDVDYRIKPLDINYGAYTAWSYNFSKGTHTFQTDALRTMLNYVRAIRAF